MNRDVLVSKIIKFTPLLHKRVFKDFHKFELSREQMSLLFCIREHNLKPMRFYGEKLMISKPNMSALSKKMSDEGYINRTHGEKDRRIVYLELTDMGQLLLREHEERVKENMLERFLVFEDKEIDRLIDLFDEINSLLEKI